VPVLLAATARSLPALVAWRFVQGLVVPGVYAVTMAFIADAWPVHGLGRAMSALVTGNVIGGFCGRVLSGVAAEHGGWRASFAVLGLTTAIAAVAAVRLLPRGGHARPVAAGAARARARDVLGARLLATFAIGACLLFTLVATFTYVTFHLSAPPFGLGPGALSWIFGVYLVGAAATPFAGRFIDRAGSRRALAAAQAFALLGCLAILSRSLAAVVAGLAVICTATFASQAAATAYLRTAAPERARALASGLYVSSYYVGGAAGGVAPALAWSLGGWRACVLLVAAVQLATVVLALRGWREEPPRAAPPRA
jgi:predicted MFS family arabinose efflux permease